MFSITLAARSSALLCLSLVLSTASAGAQCEVRSQYQLGNVLPGMSNGILQVDTGWQTNAPLFTNTSNGGSTPQGCTSTAQISTSSDFGLLQVQGSGYAANCNNSGVALYLNNAAFNDRTARFRDSAVVTSAGLPNGSPVQLRGAVRLLGYAIASGSAPSSSFGAELLVNGSPAASLLDTNGVATCVVNTSVGATVSIEGQLQAALSEAGVLNSAPAVGSFALSLQASFEFISLTPGAGLSFCSGRSYNLPNYITYCTAGTTSNGCNASMSATGVPSASASSGFTLQCTNIEGQRAGLMFYGVSGPKAAVWAPASTSYLCVKAPIQRLTSANSGGTNGACDGSLSLDFLSFVSTNPGALGQPFASGQTVNVQTWFRDPPAVATTNLSNGLQFTMQL